MLRIQFVRSFIVYLHSILTILLSALNPTINVLYICIISLIYVLYQLYNTHYVDVYFEIKERLE